MDHQGHPPCSPPGSTSPAGLGSALLEGRPGRPSYQALRPWLPAEGLVRSRKRRLGEPNRAFGMLRPLNAFHMVADAGGPGPPRGRRAGRPLAISCSPVRPLPAPSCGRHVYLCSCTVSPPPCAGMWSPDHRA